MNGIYMQRCFGDRFERDYKRICAKDHRFLFTLMAAWRTSISRQVTERLRRVLPCVKRVHYCRN